MRTLDFQNTMEFISGVWRSEAWSKVHRIVPCGAHGNSVAIMAGTPEGVVITREDQQRWVNISLERICVTFNPDAVDYVGLGMWRLAGAAMSQDLLRAIKHLNPMPDDLIIGMKRTLEWNESKVRIWAGWSRESLAALNAVPAHHL